MMIIKIREHGCVQIEEQRETYPEGERPVSTPIGSEPPAGFGPTQFECWEAVCENCGQKWGDHQCAGDWCPVQQAPSKSTPEGEEPATEPETPPASGNHQSSQMSNASGQGRATSTRSTFSPAAFPNSSDICRHCGSKGEWHNRITDECPETEVKMDESISRGVFEAARAIDRQEITSLKQSLEHTIEERDVAQEAYANACYRLDTLRAHLLTGYIWQAGETEVDCAIRHLKSKEPTK